ncbi:MAG: sodium-dependent transporter [Spartobacteria bacterium]|nr:sodium-dependent transporter [Spartobacteria bacterium]
MKKRAQWSSRTGFIVSVVGSAVGLGNIWRFPYQAYSNGGGAFLLPYLVALLTAGLPVLLLEFGLGHKYRGSAPTAFRRLSSGLEGRLGSWEWLGWWQVGVMFVISTYYMLVLSWIVRYAFLSLGSGWSADTNHFFFNEFLRVPVNGNPCHFGGLDGSSLLPVAALWGIVAVILSRGLQGGIERVNKICMPLLLAMLLLLTGRCVMLEGAGAGLDWLFRPDFAAMKKPAIWIAAYGQVFYSLGVGFAIMFAYASFLPRKSDLVNNAFITGLLDCGFSILAGILIFSMLGYTAAQTGRPLPEIVSNGIGLAFVTIPSSINLLPFPRLMGFLFFASLAIAGFTSFLSMTEPLLAAFTEKYRMARKRVLLVYCLAGFLASLPYATRSGILVLDIVDHFMNHFGILTAVLLEVAILGWVFHLDPLRRHLNAHSDFRLGRSWNICVKYITFGFLAYMVLTNLIEECGLGLSPLLTRLGACLPPAAVPAREQILQPYGGYPILAVRIFGWGILAVILAFSFILSRLRPSRPPTGEFNDDEC